MAIENTREKLEILRDLKAGDMEDAIAERRIDIKLLFEAWKTRDGIEALLVLDQFMMSQAEWVLLNSQDADETVQIDMTSGETQEFLRTCFTRQTKISEPFEHVIIEAQHKGKWLRIGRTDLRDEVRAYIDPREYDGDIMSQLEDSVVFGARIIDETFYIIDSEQDDR